MEKKDDWKWLFSVLLVVLFITWLILAWSGKYVYPQGDDFEYGANSHLAWVHGKGVLGAFGGACKTVADAFGSWQGTFSSIFLMALQPGIWGEQYYHLTPAVLSGLLSVAVLSFFLSILSYIVWSRKKGGRDSGLSAGNFGVAACTGQSICFLLVERRNSLYRCIQLFAFIHGISDTCDCPEKKKRVLYSVLAAWMAVMVGGGNLVTALIGNVVTGYVILILLWRKRKDLLKYLAVLEERC